MRRPRIHSGVESGDRSLQCRAGVLCLGVVATFSLLSWRLIHLQVERHEHFQAVLEESHHRSQELSASRGDILDTRGRVLACDEPVQQVTLELGFLQTGAALADALAAVEGMKARDLRHAFSLEELQNRYLGHLGRVAAPLFGMTAGEFEARIRERLAAKAKGEVFLSRDLSISGALKLRESLELAQLGTFRESRNRGKLGALIFQNAFARRYPTDLSLKHIVGFFGETKPPPGEEPKPARGVAGVERFFQADLTGTAGRRELEVDGWGNEIPAYRGQITPARNGRGLRLSLDLGLQGAVEQALDEVGTLEGEVYLGELQAERVVVVLFDPATMGVRAIACRDPKHGPDHPLLSNPVTEMLYEPGSTIKIVAAAGALSSGKLNRQSRIDIAASGVYDDEDITPIHDEHAMASGTVEDIIVHSSNIGAYKLGRLLGVRRFEELIRDFGFCRATGFESPMESRGSFAGQMTLQTLSRVAFGNAITVTPAQMCGALGAIINGGSYRPLHIAETWVDEDGQAVEGLPRVEAKQVVSAAAAQVVRRALLEAVEQGTGKPGRSELFQIAGKTGTARKAVTSLKDGKWRTTYQGDLICSFLGFLPADQPKLGGLVIIDTPRGTKHARYGGRIAAPLFRRIAERAMAYYEIPAQFAPKSSLQPQAANSTPVKANPRSFSR